MRHVCRPKEEGGSVPVPMPMPMPNSQSPAGMPFRPRGAVAISLLLSSSPPSIPFGPNSPTHFHLALWVMNSPQHPFLSPSAFFLSSFYNTYLICSFASFLEIPLPSPPLFSSFIHFPMLLPFPSSHHLLSIYNIFPVFSCFFSFHSPILPLLSLSPFILIWPSPPSAWTAVIFGIQLNFAIHRGQRKGEGGGGRGGDWTRPKSRMKKGGGANQRDRKNPRRPIQNWEKTK